MILWVQSVKSSVEVWDSLKILWRHDGYAIAPLSVFYSHTHHWSDRLICDNAPSESPHQIYASKIMNIHSYANRPSSLLRPQVLLLTHANAFVQLRHTHSVKHSSHFLVTGPECHRYGAFDAAGIKTDTCHQSAGPRAHCCPLWILIAHCNYVVPLVILRMHWWAAGYT